MRGRAIVCLIVAFAVSWAAHADVVNYVDYVYDDLSDTYIYYYSFSTNGTVQPGLTWGLYGLAGVTEATAGNAGQDWTASWGPTWVEFTYTGSEVSGPITFGMFDVTATAGPGSVTWRSDGSTGDPPYFGNTVGPLPEPSSLILSLAGLPLLWGLLRRRRKDHSES